MNASSLPGFTAEKSFYKPVRGYRMSRENTGMARSAVIPAQLSVCTWLGALCVAAILEPIPGDELAWCGAYFARCGGLA